jgi:hypothetical protein
MTTQISLPIRRSDGGPPAVESLPVEDLRNGRFRLLHSPGMVEGLAAGDVFELVTESPLGFRVISRGGNLVVWVFFQKRGENRGRGVDDLIHQVSQMGGVVDGYGITSLILTIPVSAGFARIGQLMDMFVGKVAGSTWMYGNVYEPADGVTPLNWWNSEV